jgi:hypothetical protein
MTRRSTLRLPSTTNWAVPEVSTLRSRRTNLMRSFCLQAATLLFLRLSVSLCRFLCRFFECLNFHVSWLSDRDRPSRLLPERHSSRVCGAKYSVASPGRSLRTLLPWNRVQRVRPGRFRVCVRAGDAHSSRAPGVPCRNSPHTVERRRWKMISVHAKETDAASAQHARAREQCNTLK